jgi:hypothetical protein
LVFTYGNWNLQKSPHFGIFKKESPASLNIGEEGWCAFRPFWELWPLPFTFWPWDGSLNSWKGQNTDPSPIHA